MMNITMMPTSRIFGHPQNPRTDLGNLDELTDSIRAMGVLQNLTVVPYDPATHSGLTVPADGNDYYVAVAGNRRLAAAKKAKLTEVPVVVSNLDYKAQMKIMLVENLQRETLTPFQQAKTIQLMLDMGETVSDIAKETGFSEATVRNRVKLAVFDPNEMAQVEDRPATMKDYLDLAKIDDDKLRSEVLKSIGTANFRNELARARSTLRDRKNRQDQQAVVQSFAKETTADHVPSLVRIDTIYASTTADKISIPKDKDTVGYFFINTSYSIELYRERTAADNAASIAHQQKQEEIKRKMTEIKAATERTAELRKDFLVQVSATKVHQHFGELVAAYGTHMLALSAKGYTNIPINHNLLKDLAGTSLDVNSKVTPAAFSSVADKQGEWAMFGLICAMLDNGAFYEDKWIKDCSYAPAYKNNPGLTGLYDVMVAMGYSMSDEEKQLQNGTHPMFYVEPEKK